jgi:phospho-N-acetylmuramoyl-pentapeptide-transferase
MINALFLLLKTKIIHFNLLNYITFRTMAAFATSFLIGVCVAPFCIRKFKEFGIKQSIRKDGPASHLIKSGTPTMGGILIIIAALISIILWTKFNYYTLIVCLGIVLFGMIGFIDDFMKIKYKDSKGIKGIVKLLMQTAVSFLLVFLLTLNPGFSDIFWKFYIPIIDKPIFIWPHYLAFIFYIFTMVAFSNAMNLSDGLDVLASGMGIILYIPFGILSYVIGNAVAAKYLIFPFITGTGELTVIIGAMIGGLTAFLWYNIHPAEVFMGDTGSLTMGGTIAIISIILKQEILLLIAGGMFVVEALSVVVQKGYFKYTKKRYGEGKRVFLMAPIHHHFEKKGWKETQVVTRFWILSALCALMALATLKVR